MIRGNCSTIPDRSRNWTHRNSRHGSGGPLARRVILELTRTPAVADGKLHDRRSRHVAGWHEQEALGINNSGPENGLVGRSSRSGGARDAMGLHAMAAWDS